MSEDKTLEKSVKIMCIDLVWCTSHNEVHEKSLDPYKEGRQTCLEGLYPKVAERVHRSIGVTWHKGDFDPRDEESGIRFSAKKLKNRAENAKKK